MKQTSPLPRTQIALILVTFASFWTYFYDYSSPAAFFWDENYHVASAQKYLNGVYFMEAHPPLGKQLIALGEYLVDANPVDNQFIDTDHAKGAPEPFSFKGYRLFPALFGWLTAPVLFLIFVELTRRPWWAMLLSGLYVFDTALIVHSRGAMLESPQLFFIALLLLIALVLWRRRATRTSALPASFLWSSLGLGACFGAIMAIKINGLIFAPLLALPLFMQGRTYLRRGAAGFALALLGALLTYVPPWYAHFAIGTTVQPKLPDRGYYQASPEYRDFLAVGATSRLSNFPRMYRDSLNFVAHYQKGVPKLNLCNKDENGSPAWWWPFGGRSISYRWDRDGDVTRHLYLQSNPAVWFLGLCGVLGSAALLLASLLSHGRLKLKQPVLLTAVLGLYAGYMGTMMQLTRVMYLYHYFIPLLLSFLLTALFVVEVRSVGPWRLNRPRKTAFLALGLALVCGCFWYFRPLAYALPLTRSELEARAWLGIWDLHCPSCELTNRVATPTCDPKVKSSPDVAISGVRADSGTQEWGEPQQDLSVEEKPLVVAGIPFHAGIGVHAHSSLKFKLNQSFTSFSGSVGLPDYLAPKPQGGGTVLFEIYVDGRKEWQSPTVTVGKPAIPFQVSLITDGSKKASTLELVVRDAGDGITNDHGAWLNPVLNR